MSATISQYFIGGMMPELASPVQQPQPVIRLSLFGTSIGILILSRVDQVGSNTVVTID